MFVCFGVVMCDSLNKKNSSTAIVHPNGKEFAGSTSCMNCHQSISKSHLKTAHFHTSGITDSTSVLGSFKPRDNVFRLNSTLKIVMLKSGDSMFQVGYVNGDEVLRKSMDMVIGSGKKGQTYLYWYGNKLFELPVSYYTPQKSWCSSPGYPENRILFNRPISFRCLECHGTFVKSFKTGDDEVYDQKQMILGVDCERCHGPAAEHVRFQQEHPEDKIGKFIINPSLLTRQQKLDNCALCHSGIRENTASSFSYVVGDRLDSFSHPDYNTDSSAILDVHGNQYGLLLASKCFKNSLSMDCSTCHNVHVSENRLAYFSEKCMDCHQQAKNTYCKLKDTTGIRLVDNCIDCHMPKLPSKKIFMEVSNDTATTHDLVRTHLIAVYREQTHVFAKKLNLKAPKMERGHDSP